MIKTPLPTRLLREPLLHFVLLGGLLFGLDHGLARRQNDPNTIERTAEVDAEVRKIFHDARGRAPNADELKTLHERWLDNEVLYREGLALQVDRGDSTIRDRVIFKTLTVVEANLALPPIDDAGLKTWFEARVQKYGEPLRLDFLEAVLVDDKSDAAARGLAAALESAAKLPTTASPVAAKAQALAAEAAHTSLRVYQGRPLANVAQAFGPDFAAALQQLAPDQWHVLASKEGPRVVRLQALHAAVPVAFEAVRGEVKQDWRDATMQSLRLAAVRQLGKKYSLREARPTEPAAVKSADARQVKVAGVAR